MFRLGINEESLKDRKTLELVNLILILKELKMCQSINI